MAHDRFADLLHDPGFHESRVERVSQVMEPVIADASSEDRGLPSSLDHADRVTIEREHQSLGLESWNQEVLESVCEGNLPSFAPSSLRASHLEKPS